MEIGYVYAIINRINGKYYIGKTFDIKKRWYKHLYNAKNKINRKIYDSMNLYGYENFSIHQIGIYQAENKKELTKILNEREKFLINLTDANIKGYNIAFGGDGGFISDEVNKKIANKRRGQKLSEESKHKISIGNKGISKPLAETTKKQISKTNKEKGIKPPPQFWGKPGYNEHPMLNKHHTEEARGRMSQYRLGKSYEEIYGKEKARKIKDEKSKKWIGNKINFKEIDLNKAEKLLKDGISFKEVSKILGISITTFNYKFREKFNMTPYQYSKL